MKIPNTYHNCHQQIISNLLNRNEKLQEYIEEYQKSLNSITIFNILHTEIINFYKKHNTDLDIIFDIVTEKTKKINNFYDKQLTALIASHEKKSKNNELLTEEVINLKNKLMQQLSKMEILFDKISIIRKITLNEQYRLIFFTNYVNLDEINKLTNKQNKENLKTQINNIEKLIFNDYVYFLQIELLSNTKKLNIIEHLNSFLVNIRKIIITKINDSYNQTMSLNTTKQTELENQQIILITLFSIIEKKIKILKNKFFILHKYKNYNEIAAAAGNINNFYILDCYSNLYKVDINTFFSIQPQLALIPIATKAQKITNITTTNDYLYASDDTGKIYKLTLNPQATQKLAKFKNTDKKIISLATLANKLFALHDNNEITIIDTTTKNSEKQQYNNVSSFTNLMPCDNKIYLICKNAESYIIDDTNKKIVKVML